MNSVDPFAHLPALVLPNAKGTSFNFNLIKILRIFPAGTGDAVFTCTVLAAD
jgi:hypothetical protein